MSPREAKVVRLQKIWKSGLIEQTGDGRWCERNERKQDNVTHSQRARTKPTHSLTQIPAEPEINTHKFTCRFLEFLIFCASAPGWGRLDSGCKTTSDGGTEEKVRGGGGGGGGATAEYCCTTYKRQEINWSQWDYVCFQTSEAVHRPLVSTPDMIRPEKVQRAQSSSADLPILSLLFSLSSSSMPNHSHTYVLQPGKQPYVDDCIFLGVEQQQEAKSCWCVNEWNTSLTTSMCNCSHYLFFFWKRWLMHRSKVQSWNNSQEINYVYKQNHLQSIFCFKTETESKTPTAPRTSCHYFQIFTASESKSWITKRPTSQPQKWCQHPPPPSPPMGVCTDAGNISKNSQRFSAWISMTHKIDLQCHLCHYFRNHIKDVFSLEISKNV